MSDRIQLTTPDDWHLHLRDGELLPLLVSHTAREFARAIVMPNLRPPVTTTAAALAYRDRILAARPASGEPGCDFQPLMTLYLTDSTSAAEIDAAAESGAIHAVKLYPAGATTNSEDGVTNIARIGAALAQMAERGLPLLVHGEVTRAEVDVYDREARFIDEVLGPIVDDNPTLKVVLEHVSTAEGGDFVMQARDGVAATLTPQHLLMDRNDLFVGGLRPHHYCLPVLKHSRHREHLLELATSGSERFFLGTDSAPHSRAAKETACGCAGIYSASSALALYAEAFDLAGALDRLEGFASHHGPDFYGLPRNDTQVTLVREDVAVPDRFPFVDDNLIPLRAGGTVAWRLSS
jgi:dihydroorotase